MRDSRSLLLVNTLHLIISNFYASRLEACNLLDADIPLTAEGECHHARATFVSEAKKHLDLYTVQREHI
jgi:hypothetical protein